MSRSCWCAQAGHQCLCVLSTWLVVCLVPCAPMSIVCPLPSCYLIIVSVAPAVSPSLPSFVSLYSLLVSAVLFWSVVFRVSMSCELNVWLCSSLLPACLFFPFGVVFVLLFNFVIKTLNSSAFESSTSSLVTKSHFNICLLQNGKHVVLSFFLSLFLSLSLKIPSNILWKCLSTWQLIDFNMNITLLSVNNYPSSMIILKYYLINPYTCLSGIYTGN